MVLTQPLSSQEAIKGEIMSTSIYLSNSSLQVLCGSGNEKSVRIERLYDFAQEEGILVNGVIVDEEALGNLIQSLWEECHFPKKNVRLIVDSSRFRSKKVFLPKVSSGDRINLLKREFEMGEEEQEYLYDAISLGFDKEKNLEAYLGILVDREFIKEYAQFFQKLGISLSCINNYLGNELKSLSYFDQFRNRSFILLQISGDTLASTLILNGEYIQSVRKRLFSDHGTEEFGVEVARTVNELFQYHAGLRSEHMIEATYLCGFQDQDLPYCQEAIGILGLSADVIKESSKVQFPVQENIFQEQREHVWAGDYLCSIGNLVDIKDKDVNFLRVLENEDLQQLWQERKRKLKKSAPIFAAMGLCIILTGGMLIYQMVLNSRLETANAYLENAEQKAQEAKAEKLQKEKKRLGREKKQIAQAMKALETYPMADEALSRRVGAIASANSAKVEIAAYNSETGVLTLHASASAEKNIHNYIKALEGEMTLFDRVDYSGYQKDTTKGIYNINVSCRLKGMDGE